MKNLPYEEIDLQKPFGPVAYRYYRAVKRRYGAIFVGGVGGGWDTPAVDLYPRLCKDLVKEEVASLRVRFRNPIDLDMSVEDVCAGLDFLQTEYVTEVLLTGHSFGGAVVIRAASKSSNVKSVITLSTQAYGTQSIARLHIPILLIHGSADKILAPTNSWLVYDLVSGPRRIEIIENAGHVLEEAPEEVYRLVREWIGKTLIQQFPSPKPAYPGVHP